MAISLHVAAAFTAKAGSAAASSVAAKGGAVPGVDAGSPFAALFGNLLADPAQLAAQEDAVRTVVQADGEASESPPEAEDAPADATAQSLVAALFLPQTAAPAPVTAKSADTGVALESALKGGTSGAAAAPLPDLDPAASGKAARGSDASAASTPDTGADGFTALLDTPAGGESLPQLAANLAAAADPAAVTRRIDVASAELTSAAPVQFAVARADAPAAAAAAAAQPAEAPAAPVAHYAIAEPVGGGRWSEAISQRALFMVDQQVKSAELHLNPPHLGPMEVKLTLDGDKASISFVTNQALVKEAVQQSLPRLQQVFADNGMAGLEVNIQLGQQSQPDNPSRQSSERRFALEGEDEATDAVGGSGGAANPLRWQGYSYARARGGVDIFA